MCYSVNDTKRVSRVTIPIKTRTVINCPFEQMMSQCMECENMAETHPPLLKTTLAVLSRDNGAQRFDKRNAFPVVSKTKCHKTDLSSAETL